MKVQFSKEVKYVPAWHNNKALPEAEQLGVVLKPLKMGELLDVLDILKAAGFNEGDEKTLSTTQMRTIAAEAGKYLQSHALLANAEDFSLQDVTEYPEFFGLAAELIFELVRLSQPSGQDAKN